MKKAVREGIVAKGKEYLEGELGKEMVNQARAQATAAFNSIRPN